MPVEAMLAFQRERERETRCCCSLRITCLTHDIYIYIYIDPVPCCPARHLIAHPSLLAKPEAPFLFPGSRLAELLGKLGFRVF